MRRRLLFCGEASYLSSGFALIHRELLSRLYRRNKLEIAELASYAEVTDIRASQVPWKIYCNAVPEGHPLHGQYHSRPENQFNLWRWERTLLDFKPDFVYSCRDNWFDRFIFESPLRPYYHFINMPCHDSEPQMDDWLEMFISADALYTYTNWAFECLKVSGGGKINLLGDMSPCADLLLNKPPLNKRQHKENHGIPADSFIIGTVMRNQKRKLFPDLFDAFRLYLDKCNKEGKSELAKRSYLYCHTSYPDAGWNICSLLRDSGIASKVYFTYLCKKCKKWFPSLFQDARTTCLYCKESTAVLPNVGYGVSAEDMPNIFKFFDIYCQYAIAEGIGVPILEAAACGVPIIVHNITGMKDFPSTLEAYPIESRANFKEMETQAIRFYPDNDQLVNTLIKYFGETESFRDEKSRRTRYLSEKNYDWEDRVDTLENYVLNAELKALQGKWDAPIQQINPNFNIPANLSNDQFIQWVFYNILQEPEKFASYTARSWLRGLNYEALFTSGQQIEAFNREQLLNVAKIRVDNKLNCERARCGLIALDNPDWIQFANRDRE